jgi:hypothetical protein
MRKQYLPPLNDNSFNLFLLELFYCLSFENFYKVQNVVKLKQKINNLLKLKQAMLILKINLPYF